MDKHKCAVVGCGRIGALLEFDPKREKPATHLGAYQKLSDIFDLVAVCDINEERAEKVAEHFNISCWFSDVEKMMNSLDIDVVSICTPPKGRFELVNKIVSSPRPPKLIFLEKPIAEDLYEADAINELCKKYRIKLMVNHTRRFSGAFRILKSSIVQKLYGEPIVFRGLFSGDVVNDGVHMADLALWLFDEGKICVENVETPYLIFEVDLIFSNARVLIRNNGARFEVYRPIESKRYEGIKELQLVKVLPYKFSFSGAILNALKEINDCLRFDREPSCGGEEGIEALKLALKWRERIWKEGS